MKQWWGICVWLAVLAATPHTLWAQAFRYQPQSATGAAQANAFSAQADDPSAIFYNAAGITQLSGIQFSATLQLLGATVDFRNAAGQMTSGDPGGTIAVPPPAQFYVTANLGDVVSKKLSGLSIGIGVSTPFALTSRYPDSSPISTSVTRAAIPLLDISPTLAYRLTNRLSVGVGADIYTFAGFVGEGHVEQRFIWPGGGGLPPGASVELNGKGTAAGVNGSVLYHALLNDDQKPILNIGAVYRSQVVLPLHGKLLVNGAPISDAQSTLVLPPSFVFAVAVWPIRDRSREWKLEVDLNYYWWNFIKHTDVTLSNGAVIPQPRNWKAVPSVSVGTEYLWLRPSLLPHWQVAFRAGYTYTQSQVPDLTFSPAIPSLTSHTFAGGVGFMCREGGNFFGMIPCGGNAALPWYPKAIGLDLSWQAWVYPDRVVQDNLNPSVDGLYQVQLFLGAMSLRAAF